MMTVILFLVVLGAISAFILFFQLKAPAIQSERHYLEIASGGFITTEQSLDELLNIFSVAGAKIEVIDRVKEATSSAYGFFVSLDDIEKILATIEQTTKTVTFQKELLNQKGIPEAYLELNGELINYYSQTEKLLNDLYKSNHFAKEMVMASGAQFFLPIFTNEALWQNANQNEIISYYQKIKVEADSTLENLSSLTVPREYRPYYDAQIAYLSQIVLVSDNIIKALEEKGEENSQNPTQLEKAYQILIGAKLENESFSEKFLQERLKIIDLKQNLSKLAPVRIQQNSLKSKFVELSTQEPPGSGIPDLLFFSSWLKNLLIFGGFTKS